MAQGFLGEVMLAAFSVVPHGWALCDGSLLSNAVYPDLFNLLGYTYGGDLISTFALPNLQGRVVVDNDNSGFPLAAFGGAPTHTLALTEMPAHNHSVAVNNVSGALGTPHDNYLAASSDPGAVAFYRPTSNGSALNPGTISTEGGGQSHENMPPYLVLNYFICIESGAYPIP